MGAICCANDDTGDNLALKSLAQDEQANAMGDAIKAKNYVGNLMLLRQAHPMIGSVTDVVYDAATGPFAKYSKVISSCRVRKTASDIPGRPSMSGGAVLLGPNLKLELTMYIVQQIFLKQNDGVTFRVRLEIEIPSDKSYSKVAELDIFSKIGPT